MDSNGKDNAEKQPKPTQLPMTSTVEGTNAKKKKSKSAIVENKQPNSAQLLYVHEEWSKAFFFTFIVSFVEILAVIMIVAHNAYNYDADAGIIALYNNTAQNQTKFTKIVDIYVSLYPKELLFLLARFVGSWIFIIFRSEDLFLLIKCINSRDMHEAFRFSIQEVKGNERKIKLSLLLRACVQFSLIVGSSVSFILTPSWAGLMINVSASLNLAILDEKAFSIIKDFCARTPGLGDVAHTVQFQSRSKSSDRLRGKINMLATVAATFVLCGIDFVQTQTRTESA